ncbi:hypothetical protein, partial [Saccharothrix sp. ST-888]|uniref:hypothetical protein n=1 Tax=Saccharothrix sp. ST-888 TaxID=1427391 RepID=UPI001E48FB1B
MHEDGHPVVEEEFVSLVLIGVGAHRIAEIVNSGQVAPLLVRCGDQVRDLELAETVPRLGGQLCEVVNARHGGRAVVGDVRVKGLDAVEAAAAVLGGFREAAEEEPELAKVAGWLAVSLD